MPDSSTKPQWMIDHEASDNAHFKDIGEKLDSILEIVNTFKLGGRGVMWVLGFIIAIGSIIALTMRIFGVRG